jgi:type VI secretion system protein ImpB
MAKEGSVAPKERVNIVYRPATGDAKEEIELPLKLLVVGDYTLRPDDRMVEEREPINIDKDNFNEVLKAQNLSLDELNKLLELREALNSLKGPMSNRPEFRKKVQELIKDEAAREQLLKELKLEE